MNLRSLANIYTKKMNPTHTQKKEEKCLTMKNEKNVNFTLVLANIS